MAFPTTSIIDNFNRSNEGPPPSSSWSTTCSAWSGGWSVSSNACLAAVSDVNSVYWNVSTFGPNCEAYFTITALGNQSGDSLGVILRLQDAGTANVDGYWLEWTQGGDITWYRLDNAGWTQLGAAASETMGANDKFGADMQSDTIEIYC